MPIKLTEPFTYNPGHAQNNLEYGEAKVTDFHVDINQKELTIQVQYGDTVSGNWIPGQAAKNVIILENRPAHIGPGGVSGIEIPANNAYDDFVNGFVTQLPTGNRVYDEVGIALYTYLLSNGVYAGSVEVES